MHGGKQHKRSDLKNSSHSGGQTGTEHKEGIAIAEQTDKANALKAESRADSKNKPSGRSSRRILLQTNSRNSSACNDDSSNNNE